MRKEKRKYKESGRRGERGTSKRETSSKNGVWHRKLRKGILKRYNIVVV